MAKRVLDLLLAGAALTVLALPMMMMALWIRLDSPGPAMYRQERVGRHGRLFRIHKFRTMHSREEGDLPLTPAHDPRITRAGAWLRARRLDELPQLLDVLRGQMSLVGPRPEVPRYVEHYPPQLRSRILSVRPGITDPASLAHRHEADLLARAADPERCYLEEVLPGKLRMQADYIERATWLTDLRVLWSSLAVLAGR